MTSIMVIAREIIKSRQQKWGLVMTSGDSKYPHSGHRPLLQEEKFLRQYK
jgi:hypothetical protein